MPDYRNPTVEYAYQTYADMLYRTAYAILQSSHDAEDAAAEVFEKFIRKQPVFHDAAHEKAWFLRVTVNTCRDHMRKRSFRSYTPLDEIAEITPAQEKDREVLESVMALDEKYRVCVLLYYFEGFRTEEIAKALRISVSAVKMRLDRARDALRTKLK